MDKKLIEQYGEDILCYRLRTARQKKRMQYEDFHKHLIQLDKEDRALDQKNKNLGWQSLDPPVQRGWKRFFVLREDVAKSKQAPFFEKILEKINTYDWSHRKDFKVKRRKYGKKIYVVKAQKLLQPEPDRFFKLGFTEEEKQFFQPEFFYYSWRAIPAIRFVFKEPWRFVLRVRPNMIDKVQVVDSEIESRMQQIDNYLERNAYRDVLWSKVFGLSRHSYIKEFEREKEKNPFKNKPVHEILDRLKEESL